MKEIVLDNKYYLHQSTSTKYVIFVHGMVETFDGYVKIKDFLVNNGINVILYNQRAHGKDATNFGHLEMHECDDMIDDLISIYNYTKNELNSSETTVIAHSMGTMVARNAMSKMKFDKVILNGMPRDTNKFVDFFTYHIFKLYAKFNLNAQSQLFNALVFRNYNKSVLNPKTSSDWVCSNEVYLNNYLNDKYCDTINTRGYYLNVIELQTRMNIKTQNPTKLLLTTGSMDPVNEFGKVCLDDFKRYQKQGFDVEVIIYDNLRHFIYDEVDTEKVYKDVLKFVEN